MQRYHPTGNPKQMEGIRTQRGNGTLPQDLHQQPPFHRGTV